MTAIDKFKKLFDKLTEQRGDQWLEKIPAWLGDHTGQVSTGTPGLIFVRTAEGQVLTVFNNIAPSEYNILVKIGRSKDQPHLWQVIERREVWSVPASSSVVHHHQQHMFMAPDMVPIDRKQILALTVLVSDPANFIVRVYGSVVHTATGIRKIETEDIDLSSYVVTEGAKFVSIESDDDGVLTVHEGTAFDAPEIGTYADVPVPDPGKYLIAFVLLYDGQSQLSNNDIRVPFPLGVIAKGSGLQIDEAAADTPADGDKFGFWDIVDDALKSITWANIKATLKTYFDAEYSALGHVHDAADVTYTPADLTDWTGSADPGDVDQALDQLADRVTAGGGGLPNPFALTADISPPALTADVDDYNPTGLSTADVVRITTDGNDYAINGLAGGADGRIIIIENITSGNRLTIPDEALTSAAANRFELHGDALSIFPKKAATFIYDATVSRWCPLAIGDSLTLRGVPISAGLPGIITDADILVYNAGDDVFEPKSPAEYMIYLEELIGDLVGAMFSGNTETGITVTYQDADGTIDLEVTPAGIGAIPNDGWIADADTWTRTGNHTFTVSGDVTAKFRKNAKVRYKDGGSYEYGVIGSSSYSSPNTTINLIPNDDYAMAAATITDTYLSYIDNPEGFPDWFNFTPTTITGWGASPPTSSHYKWRTFGVDNITFHINQPNNATSTTTTIVFSLPITAKTLTGAIWVAVPGQCVNNSGVPTSPCYGEIQSGGTDVIFYLDYAGTGWTAANNKRIVTSEISYRY